MNCFDTAKLLYYFTKIKKTQKKKANHTKIKEYH